VTLRVVFFGTPSFAVPSLSALEASRHAVVGVVTQPDRRRGRGQRVLPEAIKRTADLYGIPTWQPERVNDTGFLSRLEALQPDLGVVVAYGKILPAALLAIPRLGLINVHASILPRWRGAAPIHRAILAGDERTGVTIMRVVQELDAGPVLATEETTIGPEETSTALAERLAAMGAELLVRAVDDLATGSSQERPQDPALVTYAPRLERKESRLDWARPASEVHNHIRGLQPWPMAGARLDDYQVVLLRSRVAPTAAAEAPPGTITSVLPDALVVATEPGAVHILEIQPEGRRAMSVRAFLGGRRVVAGDRFSPLPPLGT
jgi:methionyl-tRNA formyltransferase